MKTICNTCKPYRGKVLIDGKPVGKYKSGDLFRHNLALLPQDPKSLFVKKTVREELLEMLERGESESRIEEVAALCEITPNQFFSRNSFYTTAANRMSRHVFENAVNNEDVIKLCKENL